MKHIAFLVIMLMWVVGVGGMAMAASSPISGTVGMELFVVIPHGHELAVYQQVTFSQPGVNPSVGIIQGHGPVKAINFSLKSVGPDKAVIIGNPAAVAMTYDVPWDGTSKLIHVYQYQPAQAAVVMIPRSMAVPPVLNPQWTSLKPRKIPGLLHSPTFDVLGTNNLVAGQTLAISLESGASAQSIASVPAGYPGAGIVMELILGLVALAGLALVVNWNPLRPRDTVQVQRESLLARLASLESQYRRGELDESTWKLQREELLVELEQVWTTQAG